MFSETKHNKLMLFLIIPKVASFDVEDSKTRSRNAMYQPIETTSLVNFLIAYITFTYNMRLLLRITNNTIIATTTMHKATPTPRPIHRDVRSVSG